MRDWNPKALEALVGVVQDSTANPKARRKAALKIAEYLLPKVPKKPKVLPDEFGFLVSPKLASAYRDIQLELRDLKGEPTRKIPAIAARIEKLEARSDAIRRRLQLPCPTRYSDKEAYNDVLRLGEFAGLRYDKATLTEAQQAEEAHLRARYDVHRTSPESIARGRRQELTEADRRFRSYRSTGGRPAPPLTRKERNDLKLLRRLYPAAPKPILSELDEFWVEMYRDHPFLNEQLFGVDAPKPRLEAIRIVDMTASNAWAEFAAIFTRTRDAHLEHEQAKAELKTLVPEDAKEAIGHGVRAKRSKSGAISFDLLTIATEEAGHAAV